MRLSFGGDGQFTSRTGSGGAVATTKLELVRRWTRDLFSGSRRYVYLRNDRGQTRLRGVVAHKRQAQDFKRVMMAKHGLLVQVLKFYRGEVV
jgi:hypothetical protein